MLSGALIDTGSHLSIIWGYVLGGALMLAGAVAAWFLVVQSERRSLEDIAPPLQAVVG